MKIVKSHKRSVIAGRTSRRKQFGIKTGRIGKTKMVKVLQENYGYGWDDLCEYEILTSIHMIQTKLTSYLFMMIL